MRTEAPNLYEPAHVDGVDAYLGEMRRSAAGPHPGAWGDHRALQAMWKSK